MRSFSSDYLVKTLPEKAKTKSGIEYNPKDKIWTFKSLSSVLTFDWSILEPYFDRNLIELAKIATVDCLENKAPSSTNLAFRQLKKLAKINHKNGADLITQITESHARVYFVRCEKEDKGWHPSNAGVLKILLKVWSDLRLPGLEPNVMVYLDKISIKAYISHQRN